ncbi:MAG: class I SAM-dependent methyltransferase [archaeon]
MHVAEIKMKIKNVLPKSMKKTVMGSTMLKLGNWVLDSLDNLRFKAYLKNKKSSNYIQIETDKLKWSWITYSKKYLRNSHGQDFDHPSRIVAADMIQSIIKREKTNGKIYTMLEIPVGMGSDAEHYFSKMNVDYTGMELNHRQVTINRKRLPGINFVQGNILKLDSPDASYDLVYSRHIFEHLSLKAMNIAINEVLRVAKNNAVLVFFSMDDISDHINVPIRQYHCNLLSKSKIEHYLKLNVNVDNIRIKHVKHDRNDYGDYIFHLTMKKR